MTISEVEAHSRAVVAIQALLSKHRPDSFPYRIAERALDLAFNCSRAFGRDREQELLAEAQHLIDRQVQAKLLVEQPPRLPVVCRPADCDVVRTRYLARRGALRQGVTDRLVKAKPWLTTAAHSGDSHACIC